MNINEITIGQAKELSAIFGSNGSADGLSSMLGKKVIVRTYSAGVFFGVLSEKSGNEVILKNARRMWRWQAASGVSLSSCATVGIDQARSKIVTAVQEIWLEAIEIIPVTEAAAASIEGATNVEAK